MKKIISLLAICSLVLTGCLDSDDSEDAASDTLYVTVNCSSSTDCGDNSANSKVFFVAILNVACGSFTGLDTQIYGYFAGTMTCSGGTCAGTEGSNPFRNSADDTVATIPDAGTYSIYSFIDTDGDEGPTSGEPAGCFDSQTWSGSGLTVTISTDES